ncbi:unnamed protein product [Rotaria socialis]|uniref:carbonic anhydrase n=1 Tax=Rotaria socialis TaxID=392032 RepID=A0A818ZJJ1_9BILA|nr:unnamed protein product [Rotaria socialis]CAF4559588.1 unnamed protein product [Rotaria socialis]
MATVIDNDTQSIVVGNGTDRIAIHLKQSATDTVQNQSQSLLVTSILIEIGDIEIQIRRSTKSKNEYRKENILSTSTQSPAITFHNGDQQKEPITEEKPNANPEYWDYSVIHGPRMWGKIFPHIQCKKFQSPIRIYTDQCEFDSQLVQRPFTFKFDENCCQTIENTGRSFQVTGKGSSRITGGPVVDEYQFLQFHMHWGANDLEGAEHVIDGVRLPGELHIVTWNTSKYKTPKAAAASDQFDGLMVFGILVKVVPSDNQEFAKFIDLLSNVTYKSEKININQATIALKNILPNDTQAYYTYKGSLTTPMCYESVCWIVFREIVGLSKRQFDQLRQLKYVCKGDHSTNGNISQNFRPVMPLNGRTVYRSF